MNDALLRGNLIFAIIAVFVETSSFPGTTSQTEKNQIKWYQPQISISGWLKIFIK